MLEINELIKRCIRILHISRKPTNEEYTKVARVTALGMLLFGFIGFVITIIFGVIG
ncbi:protein translocase SEC61 complex subunit gamma [Candidatus Micrarchaeota archaeon]|nr:protein translocase SEC61 complex subunit gamma [Candidatus Micrarchaeota archaeon]